MLIMAIFFKCPLYTYIEVKLKICYYGGFSKIPYFNNKRGEVVLTPLRWGLPRFDIFRGCHFYVKIGNDCKYQKLTDGVSIWQVHLE